MQPGGLFPTTDGLDLEPGALPWALLLALGLYLLVTAQPLGRPKPDLAERLRRLDVDERIRMEVAGGVAGARAPMFSSRLLEGLLRPVLEDAGRLVRSALGWLGVPALAGGAGLDRRLRVARPGVEPVQLFGEKVLVGLLGVALFPLMEAVGIHPFGPWPVWASAVGFGVGFLVPDWDLERRLAERRTAVVMELPTILDMLVIAASAGLALEQALDQVARQSAGIVARELQRASRELALGQGTLMEVLEELAARNDVPELTSLVGQLRAAHEQGIPLIQTLSTQADALREQKRLRIVEAGGKATVKMVLPVAIFILPVLFVVLLVPAGVQMLQLGGT